MQYLKINTKNSTAATFKQICFQQTRESHINVLRMQRSRKHVSRMWTG